MVSNEDMVYIRAYFRIRKIEYAMGYGLKFSQDSGPVRHTNSSAGHITKSVDNQL